MISIIVPIFKSEPYLNDLNYSLTNQTYNDLEIIYINDGSPDDSLGLLLEFEKKDSRIKVVDQNNQGAVRAVNNGLSISKGDYLMFLDADDTLALTTCQEAITVMEQQNVDMVFWLYTREFRSQNRSELGPMYFSKEKHFKTEQDMRYLRRRMIGLLAEELRNPVATDYFNAGWGKLYRSSLIKEHDIKWTDTKLVGSSDVLFNAQLMPYVRTAYYLPVYLHHYTKDNYDALTKTYGWTLFEKVRKLHNGLEEIINKNYSGNNEFAVALSNRRALSAINLTLSVSQFAFHRQSRTAMQDFLSNDIYRNAFKNLPLRFLPYHYRFFFIACRYRWTLIVLFLGRVMRFLR